MELRSAITECFASDPELLSRWHITAGMGLEACVERTLADVATFDPSFQFHPVRDGDELVGYWGTEFGSYINLIFVKPSHRNRAFLSGFWRDVQNSLSDPFYAGIYAKNEPAIRFYSRHGAIIQKLEHEGRGAVVFQFSKEPLCL